MRWATPVALISCLFCLGCGTPGWIAHPPASKDHIYAVGRWPTSYYADQRLLAAEAARSEMARTLHSRIEEHVLRVQTRYNTRTIERLRRVTSTVTATDLEGCEIVKYWKDGPGKVGPEDTVYALARMSRKNAAKTIKKIAASQLQEDEKEALEQILEGLKGNSAAPD